MNYDLKSRVITIIVLLVLAVISLILRSIYYGLKDFGLSFFVEMLGVLITVIIIDTFWELREKKKELPKQIASFEDIKNFLADFINLWLWIFRKSVPLNAPQDIKDFFSEKYMSQIWYELDLDAKMPVSHSHPNLFSWEYLSIISSELLEKANQIIDRYNICLEPENYYLIYNISKLNFLKQLKSLNHEIMEENRKKKIPRLLFHIINAPRKQDYIIVNNLIDLCNKMQKYISKYKKDIGGLTDILDYNQIIFDNTKKPQLKMPDDEKERQTRAFIESEIDLDFGVFV